MGARRAGPHSSVRCGRLMAGCYNGQSELLVHRGVTGVCLHGEGFVRRGSPQQQKPLAYPVGFPLVINVAAAF